MDLTTPLAKKPFPFFPGMWKALGPGIVWLATASFLGYSAVCFSAEAHAVRRVIDGDTLLLDNGEKLRLIGVDTPEMKHPLKEVRYFARQASEFTRRQIEGKKIRLEYDWQRKDKFGRTLAYVYREPDQFFLNAEIIKQGYGFAYTHFPFKYLEEFRAYEKNAREKGVGLWAQS